MPLDPNKLDQRYTVVTREPKAGDYTRLKKTLQHGEVIVRIMNVGEQPYPLRIEDETDFNRVLEQAAADSRWAFWLATRPAE